MFWSRACSQTFVSHTHTGASLDCESSQAEMGMILVDSAAIAQVNDAEGRITVRKIFYPMDLMCTLGSTAGFAQYSMWELVVKTKAPLDLLGESLSGLVAREDVVSCRMFGGRTTSGNATSGFDFVQQAGQAPGGLSEISVMRKLDMTESIVALYGFLTHMGSSDLLDSLWSINAVVSVLWQRTLR